MSNDTIQVNNPPVYPGEVSPEILQMIEAGVFYGLRKTKTHPQMKQFVLSNRGGVEIVNLAKTEEHLSKALAFLSETARNGGFALFVGTQPAAQAKVVEVARRFGMPYVVNRWAGGIITNFKIISGRIEYFVKLKRDLASGAFDKYTKKERLLLEREINRLKELFEGLEGMAKLPDVLVVVDPVIHHTAVREANRAGIPIVAFANLDTEPSKVQYLVPGNDNARKSIEWFLEKSGEAIASGFAKKVEKSEQVKQKDDNSPAAIR